MQCANCSESVGGRRRFGQDLLYCPGCRSWWDEGELVHCLNHVRPRPALDRVGLLYEPNGTGRNDLLLVANGWCFRCDSWLLVEDPEAEGSSGILGSLQALLEAWMADVITLQEGQERYLPFGLSDRHSRWIRCTLDRSLVVMTVGSSSVEGSLFRLGDYREAARRIADFRPQDGFAPFPVSRGDVLEDLGRSLQHLVALADSSR